MISTLLVEYAEYVRWGFAAAALLMVAIGWLLAVSDARRACAVLAGLAAVAALALTAWPEPRAAIDEVRCTVQFSVPFQGLDTLANLALLVPVAYYDTLALRRAVVVALALSGLSALVEGAQAVVPATGRICDTDDWWMNTVGVALGVLLAVLTLALAGVRDRERTRSVDRNAEQQT